MDAVKAVCKCKKMSETETVIAVKQGVTSNWGCLTWLFNAFMLLITLGFWAFFMGGWIVGKMIGDPEYRCQFCNAVVRKKQFRA